MDIRPVDADDQLRWTENRKRIELALTDDGLRYFRHGRVLPVGDAAANEGNGQTRMDFLLPAHELVIETKCIRDRQHAKRVGDELLLDVGHYAAHPTCKKLRCVIYVPEHLLANPEGLSDLEGEHKHDGSGITVRVFVLHK